MRKVVFVFLLTASYSAIAQTDTTLEKYNNRLIYRMGGNLMKGNDRMLPSELKWEFKNTPLAAELYAKATKNKTTSRILRFASLGAMVWFSTTINRNNNSLTYGILAGQLATTIAALSLERKYILQTDQAIQIYNRELLFPGRR